MAGDMELRIRIRADGTAAVAGLRSVSAEAERLGASSGDAAQGVDRLGDELNDTEGSATSAARSLGDMAKAAAAFAGIASVSDLAKSALEASEAYQVLAAKISLFSGSSADASETLAEISRIAKTTHAPLEATADLFLSLARSAKETGASQADMLQFTEAVNNALRISGTSAQAASGALTQLGQAIASGALRGDEFNSIAEQMPSIMEALAAKTGKARDELRAMAEQGLLTSDLLIGAVKDAAAQWAAQAAKLPITMGQALQDVKTAFTEYAGNSQTITAVSQSAAAAIKAIADNMSGIGDAASTAALVAIGAGLLKIGSSARDSVVNLRALAAQNREMAVSAQQTATAEATLAQARLRSANSSVEAAAAGLRVATAVKQEAAAMQAAAAEQRIYGETRAALNRQYASAAASAATAERTLQAAQRESAAATIANSAAQQTLIRSTEAARAASSALSVVVGQVAGALRTAGSVAGGALWAVVIGQSLELALNLKALYDQTKKNGEIERDLASSRERLAAKTGEVIAATEKYSGAMIRSQEQVKALSKASADEYIASLRAAEQYWQAVSAQQRQAGQSTTEAEAKIKQYHTALEQATLAISAQGNAYSVTAKQLAAVVEATEKHASNTKAAIAVEKERLAVAQQRAQAITNEKAKLQELAAVAQQRLALAQQETAVAQSEAAIAQQRLVTRQAEIQAAGNVGTAIQAEIAELQRLATEKQRAAEMADLHTQGMQLEADKAAALISAQGELSAAFKTLNLDIGQLTTGISESFGRLNEAFGQFAETTATSSESILTVFEALVGKAETIAEVAEAVGTLETALAKSGGSAEQVARGYEIATTKIGQLDPAAKKAAQAMQELDKTINGVSDAISAMAATDAIRQAFLSSKISAQEYQVKLGEVLAKLAEVRKKHDEVGDSAEENFGKAEDAADRAGDAIEKVADKSDKLERAVRKVGVSLDDFAKSGQQPFGDNVYWATKDALSETLHEWRMANDAKYRETIEANQKFWDDLLKEYTTGSARVADAVDATAPRLVALSAGVTQAAAATAAAWDKTAETVRGVSKAIDELRETASAPILRVPEVLEVDWAGVSAAGRAAIEEIARSRGQWALLAGDLNDVNAAAKRAGESLRNLSGKNVRVNLQFSSSGLSTDLMQQLIRGVRAA